MSSTPKNVTNGTKCVREENLILNEQKMFQWEQKIFADKIYS